MIVKQSIASSSLTNNKRIGPIYLLDESRNKGLQRINWIHVDIHNCILLLFKLIQLWDDPPYHLLTLALFKQVMIKTAQTFSVEGLN